MSAKLRVVDREPLPEPPYPADTRVKGWRFDLDHERIDRSDTIALAPPDMRPWLVWIWLQAWKQIPAGSFPNDDKIIAAKIGMDIKILTYHRDILLRNFRLHSDGRIYHPVVVECVKKVLDYRKTDRKRKNNRDLSDAYNYNPVNFSDRIRLESDRIRPGSAPDPTPSPSPSPTREEKNTKKKRKSASKSRPANVEEVRAYCRERKNNIDPQRWWDYYEARGWRVKGGQPIKDWKACVRTWEQNHETGTRSPAEQKAARIRAINEELEAAARRHFEDG